MKKERELLEFQVLRTIVNLYKGFSLMKSQFILQSY